MAGLNEIRQVSIQHSDQQMGPIMMIVINGSSLNFDFSRLKWSTELAVGSFGVIPLVLGC